MSVKTNEIRIGSWLKWKDNGQEFDCTAGLFIRPEFWRYVQEGDIEPIPLTPEILVACGFERIGDFLRWCERRSGLYVYGSNNYYMPNIMPEITSLHQLQNTFYALTGTELTYQSIKLW